MKRISIITSWSLLLLFLLAGCSKVSEPISKTSFLLDTIVTITLYDWDNEDTLTDVMNEISRLEALLSVNREGSDLYRLAEAAGKEWVEISPECEEVLNLSKEFWHLSGGYFDVTTGPLIDLWQIRDGEGYFPTVDERKAAQALIASEKLLIEDGRAYLEDPGMKANLGGIAKGYIVDQVRAFLVENGVEHGIIDLGRDLILIGGKPDGTPFRVGVQSPLEDRGAVAQILQIYNKSVVTSGINERYFEFEGVRYHHIINPFTGFPADTDAASVTIVSDRSSVGDALSTTCLLLGAEQSIALIEKLPDIEVLIIKQDGQQVMSSGFSSYLVESPSSS